MIKTIYFLVLVFAFCSCATNGQKQPTPNTESDPPPEPVKAKMDPGQQVAIHVAEIVKIIDKSRGDCKTCLIESLEYIEKHREEIVPHPQEIMGAFDQKCPVQNAKIGKALQLD